jgi:hypothetical protein
VIVYYRCKWTSIVARAKVISQIPHTSDGCVLANFILHQNSSKYKRIVPYLSLAVQIRKFNPDYPKIANGTLNQKEKIQQMGNYRKYRKNFRLVKESHSLRCCILLNIICHLDLLSIRHSVDTGETV